MESSLFLLLMFAIPGLMIAGQSFAKIKYGALVSDIRGAIGQEVFSVWKAGVAYVRKKASIRANPQSTDQATIRCNLANLAKYWFNTLTQAQRDLWETWALTEPGKGNGEGGILAIIRGNGGKMSGYNAFCMANQWLKSCALASPVATPPIDVDPPTPPLDIGCSWATPTLTVTWTTPVTFKESARCRIWIASHEQPVHRQLVTYAVADLDTKDITNVKGANGDVVALADVLGHYLVQMDTVDPDGSKSGPSMVQRVVID